MSKYIEQKLGVKKFGHKNKQSEEPLERGYCDYDVAINLPLTIQESMRVQGLLNKFISELDKIIGW